MALRDPAFDRPQEAARRLRLLRLLLQLLLRLRLLRRRDLLPLILAVTKRWKL
jgi:hypothetical protein